MRSLIVHNPRSGFGSDAVYAFERELVRAGDECLLRVLPNDFDAERAVADAESFDVVVASGGDGTVSEILFALRGRDVPVCVFPSGTANLLFENIGNTPEPAALARACRWCETAACDLGEVRWQAPDGTRRSRGFSLMAGSGFDAELMSAAAPNKKAMGEAAYFMAALADPSPQVVHYVIEYDGVRAERDGIACLVANNAMIQGEIEIVPNCSMNDGMLDVIVLETTDAVQLVRPLIMGLLDPKGRLPRPKIETFRGANVSVTASVPIPMQVDGEVIGEPVIRWEATVIPGANQLIVDSLSRYHGSNPQGGPRFPLPHQIAYPS